MLRCETVRSHSSQISRRSPRDPKSPHGIFRFVERVFRGVTSVHRFGRFVESTECPREVVVRIGPARQGSKRLDEFSRFTQLDWRKRRLLWADAVS